jgi:hypothetical protein
MQASLDRRAANPDGVEEAAWAEQHQTEVLDYLDDKIREMTLLEAEHHAAALMPSAEVLAKLDRYESMLNRQLFRAMKELRTLQKERRGSQNPKSDQPKSERKPKPEIREPANLPNEPIPASQPPEISNLRSEMSGDLLNEPISPNKGGVLTRPVGFNELIEQYKANVQNEGIPPNGATEEPENEEPQMEHGLNTDKNLPNEAMV